MTNSDYTPVAVTEVESMLGVEPLQQHDVRLKRNHFLSNRIKIFLIIILVASISLGIVATALIGLNMRRKYAFAVIVAFCFQRLAEL